MIFTFNASFASGPKKAPAITPITCLTSARPCIRCPIALVIGTFPTAATASRYLLAKALIALLSHSQSPFMQDVDLTILAPGCVGQLQSLAFLHCFLERLALRAFSTAPPPWYKVTVRRGLVPGL